jgi:hypothetical protein
LQRWQPSVHIDLIARSTPISSGSAQTVVLIASVCDHNRWSMQLDAVV